MEQVPQKGAKPNKNNERRQKRGNRRPCHHARDVAWSFHPGMMGLCHLAQSCPPPLPARSIFYLGGRFCSKPPWALLERLFGSF